MRYFITGATGFIGKRLVKKLLESKDSEVWFLIRQESRDKLPAVLGYLLRSPACPSLSTQRS